MNQPIIECVPNFSEGTDMNVIKQITDQIESVDGVKLLNVDPGQATNRTVVTMAGHPDNVIEAAFRSIKKASELIDMSKHKGEHPRMGATDVCPLVPISNITMEKTVEYSKKLAERVGNDLNIPVYLYEYAATTPERANLSNIRAGEYEGFFKKITEPEWKPDFGPSVFNSKTGGTVIGARDFLIAFNINLNTKSVRRANSIAFDVREAGRIKRIGDPITGEIVKNEKGEPIRIPGTLKSVKAVGWFIKEYNIAQISMNLTNTNITSVHNAFEEVCRSANERGIRVSGSELVGLIPLKCMLDAGKYFLKKQKLSSGVSENELIHIAIRSMGLSDITPFDPQKKIIEYVLNDTGGNKLINLNLKSFTDETASESPAPGGGSIAAYVGTLGASLGTMVANLSAGKRGWDDKWELFSNWAEKGQCIKDKLLFLVDEDTIAFNKIMDAFGLPKFTSVEKQIRSEEIEKATQYAIEIPYKVMQLSHESLELIESMVKEGLPNSVSDAGVAALCAETAVKGAFLNVKINSSSLKNKVYKEETLSKANLINETTAIRVNNILKIVNEKIENNK